ncbi:MAG: serine/threonine protein kinase, partial [Myxococcales bacterium]|nr:serine/threonine protein kinase [Myxococcales bacterium]
MQICPTCGASYDDSAPGRCPADDARLVAVREGSEEDAELLGTLIDGRYRVDQKLGRGGMGSVYLGVQTAVGRPVAIKVLDFSVSRDVHRVRRFLQEARAASALSHPNTVTTHDFGQTPDGHLYMVMEFVPGDTLNERLTRSGPLDPRQAGRIAVQILAGLEAAHALGIVHRDLKPDNIILSPRPGAPDLVKVLDFRRARIGLGDEPGITRSGQVFGTPAYMAPEQVRGERCDGRADQYAVGLLLYEMLAGRRPFNDPDPVAAMLTRLERAAPPFGQLKPPVVVPAAFETITLRALERAPNDRFPDVGTMRVALDSAIGDTPATPPASPASEPPNADRGQFSLALTLPQVEVTPQDAPTRPYSPPGRRAWIAPSVIALTLAAGLLWYLSRDQPRAAAGADEAAKPMAAASIADFGAASAVDLGAPPALDAALPVRV